MSWLTNLFFPPKCAACGALLSHNIPEDLALCPACEASWESEILETCGICAKPIGECACMTERMLKAKCRGFYKLVYYYPGKRERVQNRLIYTIKERRDGRSVAFLAHQMASPVERTLAEEGLAPDAVLLTYVPRGSRAIRTYGTDQAKMLAHTLGKRTGIAVHPLLRRRFGKGGQQKKLDPLGRYRNARASFAPIEKQAALLRGKSVFLVDDIVTTGASMAVSIRLLYQMGAERVWALSVASDIVNRDVGTF